MCISCIFLIMFGFCLLFVCCFVMKISGLVCVVVDWILVCWDVFVRFLVGR